MTWKLITGVVAIAMVLSFLVPLALKLKEVSLTVVIAIAVVMILIDLYQSMKSKDH